MKTFFEDTWTVAPEADRIGYRYRKGRPMSFRERKAAVRRRIGSIEHCGFRLSLRFGTGSRRARTDHLASRRRSGGGYAIIGTVISADMDRIAQMQPNNLARFVQVDMDTALKARAEYKKREGRLRSVLAG